MPGRTNVTTRSRSRNECINSSSAPTSDASESDNSELPGQDTSPEARTERKKKNVKELGLTKGMIKSSLLGMEKQRKEMNALMENFTYKGSRATS